MNILVTGGTGFIGSHLIERLRAKGDTVKCVAKDKLNVAVLESLGVEVVLGDINNGISWDSIFDGVDCVYHLAGVTRARTTKEYYDGNYLATKRFVQLCAAYCPTLKRFVYVSSLTAVGPSNDGEIVTEETLYHPVSHYGKSKMLAELEVLKMRERLPIAIVRPSAVYGPRERDMYEYMKLIKRGIQPLIGFKKKLLSLIHTDDLVNGIMLAGTHVRAVDQIYFLGSERSYSTEEIGNTIARVVHKSPLRIKLPHVLVYTVGAIAEAVGKITRQQVFFNFQKANEAVQSAWTCSVEKAQSQLGFHESILLADGMSQTYQWYRENGWL